MDTSPAWIASAVALAAGYLLGSIPFGLLLTRAAGAGDLLQVGSGNIGATNVLRTGRRGLAAATLLLDAGKGAAAVLLGGHAGADLAMVAGVGAFLGHCYPVSLRFRGGKGVATLGGVCAALSPPVGLVFALAWVGTIAATRYSSVGGMVAAVLLPVAAAAAGRFELVLVFLGLALLVLLNHGPNIERLLTGQEPRVGRRGR